MSPGPASVVDILEDYVALDRSPISLVSLILEIINQRGWYAGDEAEEKAALWLENVRNRLRSRMNEENSLGFCVSYAWNSSGTEYIQGSCFCEPGDDANVAVAKRKRSFTFQIRDAVRTFHWREVEVLCKKMLTLFGVLDPQVSRSSADAGVDFFGYSDIGAILKPQVLPSGAEKQLRVWFVGQAKHYPTTKISTREIRELVGSADLARSKIYAGNDDPLKKFTARLCDPIFSLIVTTGRFSRDSIDLMKKSGVIAMDGGQLGQFLADHGIGIEKGSFSEVTLKSWAIG